MDIRGFTNGSADMDMASSMESSRAYAESSRNAVLEVYEEHEKRKNEEAVRDAQTAKEAGRYERFKEFCCLRHMANRPDYEEDDLMTPMSFSSETLGYIEENLSRLLGEIVEINKSRDTNIPISAYATFHQWSIVYVSARKNGLARPILSSIEEHLMQALNTMMAANKP
jgi:hypothetical protein